MRRLIALLLCCTFALGASFPTRAADADPAVLNNVLAQLAKHNAVRASFTQTRSNPALAQPQVSHGTLLFVLGHGMLWQTEQPFQETIALTGSHTARMDAQGKLQPIRDARGVSQVSQMLQSLLAGKPDDVLRQFDVQARGSTAEWKLHFTPKQSRVARILGGIELNGDAFLEGIRIDMHDGSATDIRFSDTRDAGPVTAAEKSALGLP
jgi:outer membrane lipoprotein-sorting protein